MTRRVASSEGLHTTLLASSPAAPTGGNRKVSGLDIDETDFTTSQGVKVVKSFEEMGLRDELLRGAYAYGFSAPSAIQQRALPPLLAGRDVIAQAQSGTGKSSMIALAGCQVSDVSSRDPQVLVVSPTRELALQTQAVIFCNSRKKIDWLASRMREAHFTVSALHGEMPQRERDDVMGEFRSGATRVLLSSDIMARGIDVQQVSLVINYDLPNSRENYIHRIGESLRDSAPARVRAALRDVQLGVTPRIYAIPRQNSRAESFTVLRGT